MADGLVVKENSKPGSYGKGLRTGISTQYFYVTSGHLNLSIPNNKIAKHFHYHQDAVIQIPCVIGTMVINVK